MSLAIPDARRLLILLALPVLLALSYAVWSPGRRIADGRHDRRTNAVWIQHGWLGGDGWFTENRKDPEPFRNETAIQALAVRLAGHGVRYVFPHLCPCHPDGTLPPVDPAQADRFLTAFAGFKVLPWVGGVLNEHCRPDSPYWRRMFVASAVHLLQSRPQLAGLHLNIEPMPSGNPDFLLLLDELRAAMPPGKMLSVAAYPPPTRWQPSSAVHWDEAYFRQVAKRVDQLVPMMYDTGIRLPKYYTSLMDRWTGEILDWAGDTPVLLGLPAYDDAGSGYHNPKVENLERALAGIHGGLSRFDPLPVHYTGVALYSEWEMDESEWALFQKEFEKQFP